MRRESPGSEVTGAGRAQGLDGLRALAAFAVMLFHFWIYSEPIPPGGTATTFGQHLWESAKWGLLLFFVLSGFLLYRPWVRASLQGRMSPSLRRYFRLRAARIAPAYYLALGGAIVIGMLGSAPPMRMPSHGTTALFLVFGQNFSGHSLRMLDTPMWTLPIEVSFYLALPLIGALALRLGKSRGQQALLTAGVVAIGVAWAHLATSLWLYDVVLPQMLPFFGFGMLVAVLVEGRVLSTKLCRVLIGAALAAYLGNLALNVWTPSLAEALENMPVALGFAALVAVAAAGERVPAVMRARPVVWLGVVSYGTYLWHQPIMCLLGGHDLLPHNPWLELPIVLPLTLLVAWASWRLVESPVLQRAHRRRSEHSRRRARPQIGGAGDHLPQLVAALAARQPR